MSKPIVALVGKRDNHVSGLSRYADMLFQGLRRMPAIEVIIAPITSPSFPQRLVRLLRRIRVDIAAFFRIYPIRLPPAATGCDIVHLTHRSQTTILLRRIRQPVVVTVHDVIHYQYRNDPSMHIYRHPIQKWFDVLAIWLLRRADAIIASSEYTRRVLINELSLSPEKVYRIHLGVDQEQFRPCEVSKLFLKRYDLNPDLQYILHVGTEEARKNLPTLVKAFALVHEKHPNTRLLRVGRPRYREQHEQLLAQVERLGLQDAVGFIGDAPDEDMPIFYNVSDLLVFPSLAEGFGFPVVEAMACGTPVICSNTTSLPGNRRRCRSAGRATRCYSVGSSDEDDP